MNVFINKTSFLYLSRAALLSTIDFNALNFFKLNIYVQQARVCEVKGYICISLSKIMKNTKECKLSIRTLQTPIFLCSCVCFLRSTIVAVSEDTHKLASETHLLRTFRID